MPPSLRRRGRERHRTAVGNADPGAAAPGSWAAAAMGARPGWAGVTGGRWLLPALLIATGLVWIGQGTGLLRGSSFMVDDPRWAAIGLALVVGGGLLAVVGRRRAG